MMAELSCIYNQSLIFTLIAKVNQKEVTDKKAHFSEIRASLEKEATDLVGRLNKLG